MKYFNPNYWYKLWILSILLFINKTKHINTTVIDNNKNTTSYDLIFSQLNFTNINQRYLDTQQFSTKLLQQIETSNNAKHQHIKIRSKYKREVNCDNEIEASFPIIGNNFLYVSFTPNFWEKINKINNSALAQQIKKNSLLDSRMNNKMIKLLAKEIIRNKQKINLIWENITNSKKKRINIVFKYFPTVNFKTMNIKVPAEIIYYSTKIRDRDDTKNYPNQYLDNLYQGLNITLNNNDEIHLGLIDTNSDNDIIKEIQQKYPNFKTNDIEEFVEKSNYSHFCQCFSTKIKIKDSSQLYSHGILKNKFTYITKTKLNEISNIIANDPKVKQWIEHISDWNANLPAKIQQLKTYHSNQKWHVKNCEKEIIKGYIRDWSYVATSIEHELKLDELNKNVEGIKTNIENINKKIN